MAWQCADVPRHEHHAGTPPIRALKLVFDKVGVTRLAEERGLGRTAERIGPGGPAAVCREGKKRSKIMLDEWACAVSTVTTPTRKGQLEVLD